MSDYIITSDSTCDLPEEYIAKHQIPIIPLYYSLENIIYGGDKKLEPHMFYEKMRLGLMPTTMASNPEVAEQCFRKILDNGQDILHIGFSSALSSSYNSAAIVGRELSDEYPDRKIIVIDSLCASLGQGMFVHKALELKNSGNSIEQTAKWLESHKENFTHLFTVDDLNHLYRGGRVSKATAIIGTLASIKPILHVDSEGRLIPLSKTRGRKKSLHKLVEMMDDLIKGWEKENSTIFISHGDCIEDAEFLADCIRDKFGIKNIIINMVSPTIGAHSGPGTVALFFLGQHR